MSREYAEKKIKQALDVTRGNATKARQQVIAWALEDPKLMKQLAAPHMVGIVAHAVGRVMSGKTEHDIVPLPAHKGELDKEGSFGMDILRTIAGGDTAQFGQENYSRPVKKQGASQQHIDAIQQMIKKSKSTKS